MTRKNKTVLGAAVAAALVGGFATMGGEVIAADHVDGPAISSDPAADITDFYAWAEGDSVYAVVAFAGLSEAGTPAVYDPDVVYGIHVDNDGDGESDHDIWIRFGQADNGDWGVQVEGLAGQGAVQGPVEETIDAPLGQRVFAGLRDDAFFFDLQGFQETLMTGDLSFDSSRDFFAGVNVTAVSIEASLDALANGNEPFTIWATSRR